MKRVLKQAKTILRVTIQLANGTTDKFLVTNERRIKEWLYIAHNTTFPVMIEFLHDKTKTYQRL